MDKEAKPYENPNDPGNSSKFHTGKLCIEPGCGEPAGTTWSHLWCQKCNAQRINRINAQFDSMLGGQ